MADAFGSESSQTAIRDMLPGISHRNSPGRTPGVLRSPPYDLGNSQGPPRPHRPSPAERGAVWCYVDRKREISKWWIPVTMATMRRHDDVKYICVITFLMRRVELSADALWNRPSRSGGHTPCSPPISPSWKLCSADGRTAGRTDPENSQEKSLSNLHVSGN